MPTPSKGQVTKDSTIKATPPSNQAKPNSAPPQVKPSPGPHQATPKPPVKQVQKGSTPTDRGSISSSLQVAPAPINRPPPTGPVQPGRPSKYLMQIDRPKGPEQSGNTTYKYAISCLWVVTSTEIDEDVLDGVEAQIYVYERLEPIHVLGDKMIDFGVLSVEELDDHHYNRGLVYCERMMHGEIS